MGRGISDGIRSERQPSAAHGARKACRCARSEISGSGAVLDGKNQRRVRAGGAQPKLPRAAAIGNIEEVGLANAGRADVGEGAAATVLWNERPGVTRALLRSNEALGKG